MWVAFQIIITVICALTIQPSFNENVIFFNLLLLFLNRLSVSKFYFPYGLLLDRTKDENQREIS